MARAATSLTVNGLDLEDLGFSTERVEGLDDSPELSWATERIPGLAGTLVVGPRQPVIGERTVTVVGHLLADTPAAVETALRNVVTAAGQGLVELASTRSPARCALGYLAGVVEAPYPAQYSQPAARLTLRFQCPDPWRYDVAGLTVALAAASTAYPLPLGSAPVKPVVVIAGAVTNPTLVYREASGTARCTMGFTITLGANDFLTIDADAGTITKSVAGTVTDAYSTWTTKSDGLLVLDPGDGDGLASAWPTLEVTGSGATGEVRYRRAWR